MRLLKEVSLTRITIDGVVKDGNNKCEGGQLVRLLVMIATTHLGQGSARLAKAARSP